MKCPKCGRKLKFQAKALYGEVYICEKCRILVIDLIGYK